MQVCIRQVLQTGEQVKGLRLCGCRVKHRKVNAPMLQPLSVFGFAVKAKLS